MRADHLVLCVLTCLFFFERAVAHCATTQEPVPLRRSVDMLRWECVIPGPDKTDWAGGFFPLTLEFSEEYPVKPPKVRGHTCRLPAHLHPL